MPDRASRFTVENKKREIYSDFTINLDRNPLTGFLARITNEDSIKQSIQNLVLTIRTERPYDALIGSKINSLLFEPFDPITEELIKDEIASVIANYEPRAILGEIRVDADEDLNAYRVSVLFGVINIPDKQFSLDLIIDRTR